MNSGLPAQIEPFALVRRGACLEGRFSFEKMPRLCELLLDSAGSAQVALQFGESEFLPPTVAGQIKATVMLECQRCSHPLKVNLVVNSELRILRSERAMKNLPRADDVLVVEDDMVDLVKLVEDEILLNLPMIAKHDEKDCAVQLPYEC